MSYSDLTRMTFMDIVKIVKTVILLSIAKEIYQAQSRPDVIFAQGMPWVNNQKIMSKKRREAAKRYVEEWDERNR